jgi:hypothetical protein
MKDVAFQWEQLSYPGSRGASAIMREPGSTHFSGANGCGDQFDSWSGSVSDDLQLGGFIHGGEELIDP